MTSDDLDTWRVCNSQQFVAADSESGTSFALNNVPEAQDSCKVRKNQKSCDDRKNNDRNGLRKRPMAGVTLRDLDPGETVYGSSISMNTINVTCNAKPAPESNETRPDTIDHKIRRFRPNTSCITS